MCLKKERYTRSDRVIVAIIIAGAIAAMGALANAVILMPQHNLRLGGLEKETAKQELRIDKLQERIDENHEILIRLETYLER